MPSWAWFVIGFVASWILHRMGGGIPGVGGKTS